jgi:hypothetical protein
MSNLISQIAPVASIPPQPLPKPSGALAAQPCPVPLPEVFRTTIPPAVPLPKGAAPAAPAPRQSPRCSVKGCVFPVSGWGKTICRSHELQQSEGELFQSQQPSYLLSLYAPFGVPDHEPDNSRQEDRNRQAAEREAFLMDEVA